MGVLIENFSGRGFNRKLLRKKVPVRISIEKLSEETFLQGFQQKAAIKRDFCKDFNGKPLRIKVSVRISMGERFL